MLVEHVREFGRKRLPPESTRWGRMDCLSADVIGDVRDQGLFDLLVPESEGGAGLSYAVVAEALAALAESDGSVALVVAEHIAAGLCVPNPSDDLATLGWPIEDQAVVTVGSNGRIADATVPFVIAARLARWLLVPTTGLPSPHGSTITWALVDLHGVGVDISAVATFGMRGAGTGDVRLVGATAVAARPEGVSASLRRILSAAIAVGIGRGAFREGLAYARTRVQFGEPIGAFQAIQWKLANMATDLDAAALLVQRAAARLDAREDARIESARAHAFVASRIPIHGSEALQIHGGLGYTAHAHVEQQFRDARFCAVGPFEPAVERRALATGIRCRFER